MKTFTHLLLVALLLAASSVHAATISYYKRDITTRNRSGSITVNQNDYKASWNAQTSSINTQVLPDFNNRLGGNNTFSRLVIDFATGNNASVDFELAVDATYGGAIYFDNAFVKKDTTDLWWGGNWNNRTEILSFSANSLSLGNHLLEVFWAENCCNGVNSGRFRVNNGINIGTWQTLSVTRLNTLKPVPVPAALWLLGSGLIVLMSVNRKKAVV